MTEQKKAERQLEESLRDLQLAQRIAKLGNWTFEPSRDEIRWSAQMFAILGLEPGEAEPSLELLALLLDREDLETLKDALERGVEHGTPFELILRMERPDKAIRWVEVIGEPETDRGPKGHVVRGITQDITERQLGDEERNQLQHQLLHAQKLESVGRLAGGVAHDFNNMLGVILGSLELALESVPREEHLHQDLREVQAAARRSAELTRQLLAFARRQPVNPVVLDLNATVTGMLKMLKRLIGEDTELVFDPGSPIWPVSLDPGQVDQILANLCINARDAMTGPGRIVIETENIRAAGSQLQKPSDVRGEEFVRLTVRDNGCGMDEATLQRVFEPFFTTKPVGSGTGLGLSTVYGIVRQNEGFVRVESNVGQGTTFFLYFPKTGPREPHAAESKEDSLPRGAGEVILFVEDEGALLRLGTRMLERLDYRVLAADGPKNALALARPHAGKINLLVTDVVMPIMSGRELALHLRAIDPNIKVLFMSGYAPEVVSSEGRLGVEASFLQKPFSREQLARAVREALGPPPRG